MQLEDYFNFLSTNDIRIKGHRIGIESVLYEYIHRAKTAEEIVQQYPTLSLEEVYATILYYLHNKEAVGKYFTDWLDYCRQSREKQASESSPLLDRMRKLKAERAATARSGT